MKPITIAICTHNRCRFLARALEALLDECGTGEVADILVVDNRSTDETRRTVEDFSARAPFVRYVHEDRLGLSHARNRAYNESDSAYVAYLDDDAIVSPGWLASLSEAIGRVGAVPSVIGGPIYPMFEVAPPAWFDPGYVTRVFAEAPGPLEGLAAPFGFSGGNMAIARSLLEALGGFDPTLGMRGTRVDIGEETDFFVRLYGRFGNRTYNAPGMAVRHHEAAQKFRLRYLISRMYSTGSYSVRFLARVYGLPRAVLFGIGKTAKQFGEGMLRLPLALFRRRERFRALRSVVTAAGAARGVVSLLGRRGGGMGMPGG